MDLGFAEETQGRLGKRTNGPREMSFDLACTRADIVTSWQWFRLKERFNPMYSICIRLTLLDRPIERGRG